MIDLALAAAFAVAVAHWSISLWGALRFRAPPAALGPPAAVIIPAFDEAAVIGACLARLAACDPPPAEIVVVDDGSRDDTAARAAAAGALIPALQVIRTPNRGKGAALDVGLAATTAPAVVVLDADTALAPDALRHLTSPFADPAVGAVAGRVRVGPRGQIERLQALEYAVAIDFARRAQAQLNAVITVPGACGAFRREAIVRAGGFASPTLAEDTDATLRCHALGDQRVVYAPAAVAWTEAPGGWPALFRQRCRWTTGNLQCLWRHRRALGRRGWLGRWALPAFLVGHLAQGLSPVLVGLAVWLALRSPGWAALWVGVHSALTVAAAALALRASGDGVRPLLWLPLQRLSFAVLYTGVFWVVAGRLIARRVPGWQKLDRLGPAPPTGPAP